MLDAARELSNLELETAISILSRELDSRRVSDIGQARLGKIAIGIMESAMGCRLNLRTRERDQYYARVVIAGFLRARGLSYPQIGKILHKDHSTIVHMIEMTEDLECYQDFQKIKESFIKELEDESKDQEA